MKYNVPGIQSIGYLSGDRLNKDLMKLALVGLPPMIFTVPTIIKGIKDAKMEWETEESDGVPVQTAKLQFFSTDSIPDYKNLAFIVKTVVGNRMLIGTDDSGFPSVKRTESTGTASNEAKGIVYEVSHKAVRAVINLLV